MKYEKAIDHDFEIREMGGGARGVFPSGLDWAVAFITPNKHGLHFVINDGYADIIDGDGVQVGTVYLDPVATLINLRKENGDNR